MVGAHAVYERTKGGDVEPTTTNDADVAIVPTLVLPSPMVGDRMRAAGFRPLREIEAQLDPVRRRYADQPGLWGRAMSDRGTPRFEVDLLVPQTLAGRGRRGVGALRHHGKDATRRVPGLELAVLDRSEEEIEDFADGSTRPAWVAGCAGLLCAKAYKLGERVEAALRGEIDRVRAKDAVDMFRIMAVADAAAVREVFDRHERDVDSDDNGRPIRRGREHLIMVYRDGHLPTLTAEGLGALVAAEQVEATLDEWFGTFIG